MDFITLLTFCFVLVAVQGRRHHNDLSEKLEEIVEDIMEKEAERKLLDSMNDPFTVSTTDPNFKMCWGAGINCHHCGTCGPNKNGGWCVSDLTNQPGPQCLCNYGWTGGNAVYIPDTDVSYHSTGWGVNRIRADSCDVPCHYTYDVKNNTCIDKCFIDPDSCKTTTTKKPNIACDPQCGKFNGHCEVYKVDPYTGQIEERCLCCRGWAGVGKVWSDKHNTYWAQYCDQECQWLNKENDQCIKRPDNVPLCNPKCTKENNGKCLPNGRCECCRDWTGPNAKHGSDGKILADYCDVYCPFTVDTNRHDLCVEPDYINRRREEGHGIVV